MSLVSVASTTPSVALETLIKDTLDLAASSRAGSTVRQYQSSWKAFEAFCEKHGLDLMPASPRAVAIYLTSLAREGRAVSTIIGHLSAIKYFHQEASRPVNWEDPIISQVIAGIQRTTTLKVEKASALLSDDIGQLIAALGGGMSGLRDRAIFLIGFAGAFRRSEITALTAENLDFVEDGVVIRLDRSKTDQTGQGAEVCIPHGKDATMCPVSALRTWLAAAGITTGPVFRSLSKHGTLGLAAMSEEAIRLILAKAVEKAGLSGKITPHSLRAGFCTQASLKGADLAQIARQARHSSPKTTMGYIRVSERFKNHAGADLL